MTEIERQRRQQTRDRIGAAVVLAFVALTILALVTGGGLAQEDNATTNETETETAETENGETHTLAVETEGEPVSYTVTASSPVTLEENEEDDTIQDDRSANGRVGGTPWDNDSEANDTRDVILYKGEIESFQYSGEDIVTYIDGEAVDPDEISENPEPVTAENASETPNETDSNGTINNSSANVSENESSPIVNTSDENETASNETDGSDSTDSTDDTNDTGDIGNAGDSNETEDNSSGMDNRSMNESASVVEERDFGTFLKGLAIGLVGIGILVASVVIIVRP